MADRGALEAAAAAGVIKAEQVGPLHDFLSSPDAGVSSKPSGEEDLRFIRNFHDLFLATGIVLLAFGLAIGVTAYVTTSGIQDPQTGAIMTGALFAGCGAIMWLLGEFFARRRRLFLPAIAIVCSFTLFLAMAVALLYAGAVVGQGFEESGLNMSRMPQELRIGILVATVCAFVAPFVFYLRFRLPFSLGLAGFGLAVFIIVAALVANFELTQQFISPLLLGLGVLLFLAGVWFDARDPQRATRFSDNGFWLHFAAAPLILNGAFGLISRAFGEPILLARLGGSIDNETAAAQAAVTLLVVIALGLLSLLINRRVLIVSALLTTGVAIGVLLNAVGLGAGSLAAATLITLGAFVLILGAGWHAVRRALLGWVKPDGFWARVFPPESAAPA